MVVASRVRNLLVIAMNLNLRTLALTSAVLLVATAAVAPTAQAAAVEPEVTMTTCRAPNPDAWVNVCVDLNPTMRSVNAYTVDTTPTTVPICPVGTLCANVPVIMGGLIVAHRYYYTIYNPAMQYNVNSDRIISDVCAVVGIVCPILAAIGTTTTTADVSSGLPTVDALGNTFEGVTLDEAGYLSELVFSTPDGLVFVVPIA